MTEKTKISTDQVVDILRRRHPEPEFACIRELRVGSGYGISERRMDFWAIDAAPSKGCRAYAYEVKVSRADFLRDLKDADRKHRGALAYSNEFFYAAPAGLIEPGELPAWAGLLEIDAEDRFFERPWYRGKIVVPAFPREKFRPSWPFVVSLLRRI